MSPCGVSAIKAMDTCKHNHLALLPTEKIRCRCRYCHLTISADELNGGYCPECYEASGKKRYEFDKLAAEATGKVRYRCEDCGLIVDCE